MTSFSPSQRPLHESYWEKKKQKQKQKQNKTKTKKLGEPPRRVTASPFFDSHKGHTPGQANFSSYKDLSSPLQ